MVRTYMVVSKHEHIIYKYIGHATCMFVFPEGVALAPLSHRYWERPASRGHLDGFACWMARRRTGWMAECIWTLYDTYRIPSNYLDIGYDDPYLKTVWLNTWSLDHSPTFKFGLLISCIVSGILDTCVGDTQRREKLSMAQRTGVYKTKS